MSRDSSDVDNALVAKLGADATLLSLMPNGVYWDEAPPGSTRFVIVSLIIATDTAMFGGRAYEDRRYQVEARGLSTTTPPTDMRNAAARIDELLEGGDLTIEGYGVMVMQRVESIRLTEVDSVDASLRWFHRGGRYQVMVAPAAT